LYECGICYHSCLALDFETTFPSASTNQID